MIVVQRIKMALQARTIDDCGRRQGHFQPILDRSDGFFDIVKCHDTAGYQHRCCRKLLVSRQAFLESTIDTGLVECLTL